MCQKLNQCNHAKKKNERLHGSQRKGEKREQKYVQIQGVYLCQKEDEDRNDNLQEEIMETTSLYDLLIGEDGVDVNVQFDVRTALILGIVLFLAISGSIVLSGSLLKS